MVRSPDQLAEPVDSDVDLSIPAQRREFDRGHLAVLAAVALGGGVGAAARYGAALAWPTATGDFPLTTFVVNIVGCALIGILMVAVTEARTVHRLTRPFLGTGVLGGFTTFSTWVLDIQSLVDAGQARLAVVCLAATPVAALAAVGCAVWAARRLLAWRR